LSQYVIIFFFLFFFFFTRRYNPGWILACFEPTQHCRFFQVAVAGRKPNPLTRRTGVSLLVWAITFDLPGMGGPVSSYATAGIAVRII
jgi:hypothetical protein